MGNGAGDSVVHGGNLRWAEQAFGVRRSEIIDFSANINRTPWPAPFEDALRASLNRRQDYPDPEYEELKRTVARQTGVPFPCISVGNGSIELLYALSRWRPGLRMILLEPTFGEYRRVLEMTGGEALAYRLTAGSQWRFDRSVVDGLLEKADGIIVCTPNNPTGVLLHQDDVQWLLSHADRGKLVVFDEAFMDYVEDVDAGNPVSAIRPAVTRETVVVLRSLTKFFGMAGLRLGLGFAGPKLTAAIRSQQEPWTVNCVAEGLGFVVYGADTAARTWRAQCRHTMAAARQQLYEGVVQLGLTVYPSSAPFLMVDTARWGMQAAEFQAELGRQGFLVRDCSSFFGPGSTYVRIAVRSSADNTRLLQAIKEVRC